MGGNIVARGHKQAFCLVDLWQSHPGLAGDAARRSSTTCDFQGISAGWADVYNRGLDCQWIDITGVPSGRYVLEVQINPARVDPEDNYRTTSGGRRSSFHEAAIRRPASVTRNEHGQCEKIA